MYYTCEEVAEVFKVKVRTVWSWIRKGKLPAARLVGQYRISDKDLRTFMENGRKVNQTTQSSGTQQDQTGA